MKKLEMKKLENITGGLDPWVEGFCFGAGVSALIAPNPVSVGISAGCLVAGLFD